jgi:YjbE family integral membrane protein
MGDFVLHAGDMPKIARSANGNRRDKPVLANCHRLPYKYGRISTVPETREQKVELGLNFPSLSDPQFWVAAGKIIWINILLSGDNAVVIALACRSLPPRERKWGIILGAGAAVLLRILFTAIVAQVMELPFLKLVGGVALLWIAIKLAAPGDEHDEDSIEAGSNLWRAVRIVAIADIVMSLDNVIAIAAAARGDLVLIGFGLAVSIPMIVAGAALLTALLNRFPVLIWAGAALLGWIAGEIMIEDPAVAGYLGAETVHRFVYVAAGVGAFFVVVVAFQLNRLKKLHSSHTPIEPAPEVLGPKEVHRHRL